jgi:transcriptional regulator with GAF, ATPase, and Fis domain
MKINTNAFFRQATIRICGTLDIQTAMERSFLFIKDYLPVDRMNLDLLDPGRNILHLVASVPSQGVKAFDQIIALPEEGRNVRAVHWASNEKIRIDNLTDPEPSILRLLKKFGLSQQVSVMFMRLEIEGNRIGQLVLVANGVGRFTDEHARLLQLLNEPFAIAMSNALKHQEVLKLQDMLADDNRYLQRQLQELSGMEIIGADFGLKSIMDMVQQVAPLDSPVLLLGETGVGKEVLANAIHQLSQRRECPMITVNCGAIPDTLLDSELFGHEKGAFTGAVNQKRGRFERAHTGTIFLDEIGELPLQAQVRLLHVLQNREIERVGGTQAIPVDIRVISATHRNLEEMIASGQFREDLWFRLNVFPIMIPPLRQRKADIPALVHHFIERKAREIKIKERPRLAPGVIDRLIAYNWPGNIRELENMVERALIQHRGGNLLIDSPLPSPESPGSPAESASNAGPMLSLDEVARDHIQQALKQAKGKINGPAGAAELLKIHPNTLRKKMDRLAIAYGKKRYEAQN